jgi:cysteinyl-tRNA synthetase
MANLIDTMLAKADMDLREAVASYGSQLSWAQTETARAKAKIARVQALMEKYRDEKRYDVADAIREALNGQVE